MATIAPYGVYQAFDDNGDPLAGGELYTYEAGTTTPKPTYTDYTGLVANTNPVVLDASGMANVWLGDGGYKFVLKDSDGNTIFTVDGIGGTNDTAFGANVNAISSNTIINSTYANSVNIATNSPTLSLLPAATGGEGFYFSVKNQGSGIVTIDPDGAELIDGASSKSIEAGASALIITNGTTWYTLFLATISATGNNTFSGTQTFTGILNTPNDGTLTIASGIVTVTGAYHSIDTEGAAASDDLVTINGFQNGSMLVIRTENDARDVVLKHNTGNIYNPALTDITLLSTYDMVFLKYDTTLAKWVVQAPLARQVKNPTKTILTSGSAATYNTPSGVTRIVVKMVGGGGGGGAAATNAGVTGTTTSFGSFTAVGGSAGAAGTTGVVNGGVGGTGGTGSADLRIAGGRGMGSYASGGSGGFGGGTVLGAPTPGGIAGAAGNAAVVNTGAGGGGAPTTGSNNGAGGGGGGEYVEVAINSPATSYTYTVGGGGAGGTAGTLAGGNGGSGIIIVEEYYGM